MFLNDKENSNECAPPEIRHLVIEIVVNLWNLKFVKENECV